MSTNHNQYQSEILIDFFKDDEDMSKGNTAFAKSGLMRCILLFGSAILALSLVIIPVLNEKSNKHTAQSLYPANVDTMATGSIKR